jgi:hypothetical protein
LASADNADCVKRIITWTWDGQYEGLRIPVLTPSPDILDNDAKTKVETKVD